MAVDTPARIAIVGAGPTGLEAALYARYLGFQVDLFERGRVGEHVRQWGHVRLFSSAGMNCSKLGVAALAAQDQDWLPPASDALQTGEQLAESYLLPLSRSDLLADSVHEQTEVLQIGRDGPLKTDAVGDPQRGEGMFRILTRSPQGEEIYLADVVIDASGTFGQANWLGCGGIPAVGERALRDQIEYRLPDIQGSEREHYAGRHTLVVGGGYSAATNVVALAQLAATEPATRVTWITRDERSAGPGGPVRRIEEDRLPERDRLAGAANELAAGGGPVTHLAGASVDRVALVDGLFEVALHESDEPLVQVERIIANVGFRPDVEIHRELQVHQCYASEGPMKLAAMLMKQSSADCLDQAAAGPAVLVNPEPNFYILGAKSYGRNSQYLMSIGREQIREVFSVIGDRADLDLYATF